MEQRSFQSLRKNVFVGSLRFIVTDKNILFNAFDSCVGLFFKNPRKTIKTFLNPDEVFSIDVNNRKDYFISFQSIKKLAEFSPRPDAIDFLREVELIDVESA